MLAWKLFHRCVLTDSFLQRCGVSLCSVSFFCKPNIFSGTHVRGFDSSSKQMWYRAASNLVWCVWFESNRVIHDNKNTSVFNLLHLFVSQLKESASLAFTPHVAPSHCHPIFSFLGLSPLSASAQRYVPVH